MLQKATHHQEHSMQSQTSTKKVKHENKKPGQRRCQKPSCRMCSYTGLQPGQIRESITIAHSGEEIVIKSPIDCQTSNVIYELHCKKDSLPYIGETSKTAETRFVGHLNTILQECHSSWPTFPFSWPQPYRHSSNTF